jgi:hypothetical protein
MQRRSIPDGRRRLDPSTIQMFCFGRKLTYPFFYTLFHLTNIKNFGVACGDLLLDCLRFAPAIQYVFASYPKPSIPLARNAAFPFVRFGEQARQLPNRKAGQTFVWPALWVLLDSNQRPLPCQGSALTN